MPVNITNNYNNRKLELTEIDNDEYVKNAFKVHPGSLQSVPIFFFLLVSLNRIPIDHCDINLEPDYQRDLVWPEGKQIAVNTFNDGSETRTCMDRKQPLYRFMDRYTSHVESSDITTAT
ncbi:hypothetical protein F5887DRAFT_1079277 [Amanita rubescens]|nr:hypothetical protein F5887DRAFT_1085736 [Amanita rubescens]KAF8335196.1 hypothetical protein F5887DRAFT_1079277 [Amanita rubescens]